MRENQHQSQNQRTARRRGHGAQRHRKVCHLNTADAQPSKLDVAPLLVPNLYPGVKLEQRAEG